MGNSTSIAITANNKGLEKDLNESEALVKQFASGVKVALAVVAGAFVFDKIKDSLGSWISDASKAERATAKLAAQIDATGGTAGYSADQLAEMADYIEKLTGVEADAVQQAQTLLLTFDNIRGDQFQRATELATDLAVTMGTDVAGAARVLGKALDDPVDAVNALARAGVDFTEEQKDMIKSMAEAGDVVGAQTIILDALEGKVGGVAAKLGQTFSGRVEILQAKIGDLGEEIANYLIPYIEALMPAAEIAVGGIMEIIKIVGEMIGVSDDTSAWAESFTDSFKWIVEMGVSLFTTLLAFFETWYLQVEAISFKVLLAFVTTFEDLKKWITKDIPAYLEWFGENWYNILTDMANITATIFSNMYENIVVFFENIYKWLAGDKVDWKWTALTKGFESSLSELPEIAQRQLSDTEKYLAESAAQIDKQVADTFDRRQQQGKEFVDKMFQVKKLERPVFETTESKDRRTLGKGDKADKKDEKTDTKETKATAGTTTGVEELYKKISEGSANVSDQQKTYFESMAQATETLTEATREATKVNQEQAAKEPVDYTAMLGDIVSTLKTATDYMGLTAKNTGEITTGVE